MKIKKSLQSMGLIALVAVCWNTAVMAAPTAKITKVVTTPPSTRISQDVVLTDGDTPTLTVAGKNNVVQVVYPHGMAGSSLLQVKVAGQDNYVTIKIPDSSSTTPSILKKSGSSSNTRVTTRNVQQKGEIPYVIVMITSPSAQPVTTPAPTPAKKKVHPPSRPTTPVKEARVEKQEKPKEY